MRLKVVNELKDFKRLVKAVEKDCDLSNKAKLLRVISGINTRDLSERLGISQTSISFLENKKQKMSLNSALAYSSYFEIPIEIFLLESLTDVEINYLERRLENLKNSHSAK